MTSEPLDAQARRAVEPVICYPPEALAQPSLSGFETLSLVSEVQVPPREGTCVDVAAGQVFRISCPEGSQVGDLNLWNAADLSERFFSGKTRALHGTHVGIGDRLWSCLPMLRPMATILADSLNWYGFDAFGGGVHDVIGTRCDPYTHALLSDGGQYHHCCHSNLTRALADHRGMDLVDAEPLVHDVMNVFMCTGFTRDTGQYFMKASPARQGDHIDFLSEIDLVVGLSACPGGDCSTTHSSDVAVCHPLQISVFDVPGRVHQVPKRSPYDRSHGR